MKILKGDFIEGEKVIVLINGEEIKRKVYYSKAVGDLYIMYKNNMYFYYEFLKEQ